MKTIVSAILLILLLVSVFMGAFNVQSAKANASSRDAIQTADTDWWPMFHHDTNHTGTSTSTAPTTNNTLWTYTTGGNVESSPAVVDGFVYVGSDDDNVYCLNASTGALVWSYKTGGNVDSPPAVAGGLVYVGSNDNSTYCLNATNGALVWNYTTGGPVVYSSPAFAGGLVYVGSDDDNVYCLNASTGALVWNYKTGNGVWSSPAVVNGVVYVGSEDGKIYAFGPSSLGASVLPLILIVIGAVAIVCCVVGYSVHRRQKRKQAARAPNNDSPMMQLIPFTKA